MIFWLYLSEIGQKMRFQTSITTILLFLGHSLLADGADVAGVDDGAEMAERGAHKQVRRVAIGVISSDFIETFFHGPQAGKGDVGAGRSLNLMHLVWVHHAPGDLDVVVVKRFNVDADGVVTHSHGHRLVAVAQAKVYAGMSSKQWLTLAVIGENGRLVDAVFQQQGTLQQAVSGQAQALVPLLAVAQGIVTPLLAHCCQCLPQVKIVDMVVDVDHCFNSKRRCSDLCMT